METEILYCVLGFAAGVVFSRNYKKPNAKKQKQVICQEASKASRLEKLLHNIESYDGTEKNQMQISIEEE